MAATDASPRQSMCWAAQCGHEARLVCGVCRVARYCTLRCAQADWRARHAAVCTSADAAVGAPGDDLTRRAEFSVDQRRFLLWVARQTALAALKGRAAPVVAAQTRAAAARLGLDGPCGGCFVTYKTRAAAGSTLRGCVGVFRPAEPLYLVVASRAEASLRDSRFAAQPITVREMRADIVICVSILTLPRRVRDPLREVQVGMHGVTVTEAATGARGTYLPEVAVEQGWDTRRLLEEVAFSKAGIARRRGADIFVDPGVQWETFESTAVCEDRERAQ